MGSRRRPPVPVALTLAAVVAGAALRVEDLVERRTLWLDEAMVALNVVHRGFHGLTKPLDYNQAAPVGWLWVQRALVLAFGNNVTTLRAFPLSCGLAALVLFALLAWRVLGPWPATIATTLFALSPAAIRYSAEAKQYSSDVAVALVLIWLVVGPGGRPSRARLVAWGGVASLAVWLSHPAVLVLGASAVVLVIDAMARRDRRAIVATVACSMGWIASWGVLWAVSLHALRRNQALEAYWAAGVSPRPFTVGGFVRWIPRVVSSFLHDPGHLALPILAVAVAALGVASLARRSAYPAGLIVAVAAAALAAASLRLFPLRGRLALYLLPALLLALGAALDAAKQWAPSGSRLVPGVALAALVATVAAAGVGDGTAMAIHPFVTPATADLLGYVASHRRPGDVLWVQWPELPTVLYHAPSEGLVPAATIVDGVSGGCGGDDLSAALRGARRVWVVFGYRLSTAPATERAQLVDVLSAAATPRLVVRRPGAVLYLLDPSSGQLGAAAAAAAPSRPRAGPTPALACVHLEPLRGPFGTGLRSGPLGSGHLT